MRESDMNSLKGQLAFMKKRISNNQRVMEKIDGLMNALDQPSVNQTHFMEAAFPIF